MKLLFAVTTALLAATLLASEVHGAPHSEITSEQLGNVVQQLQQIMVQNEMKSKLAGEQQRPLAGEQYYGYYAGEQQRPLAGKQRYGPVAGEQQRPLITKTEGFGELQIQSSNEARDRASMKEVGQKARSQGEKASMQVQGVQILNCGSAGGIINSALSVLGFLFPSQFGVLVNCAISPGCVQVRVDVPADDVVADIDVCDLGGGNGCVEVYVEPTTPCTGLGVIPIFIPIPIGGGQQVVVDIRIRTGGFFGAPCATVKVDAPSCP